jgi:hypothetical protein
MNKEQVGGDVIYELRNLAIPFVLMLAKNGMDYIQSNKQKSKKVNKPRASPPKTKKTKGGCGCSARPAIGGNDEITKLANNLNQVMASYKI